jgi:hypothetical protein
MAMLVTDWQEVFKFSEEPCLISGRKGEFKPHGRALASRLVVLAAP